MSYLVSVGMPVFNGEQYLRRAIDSVLAQDYPHFEIIISDNASTDRTRDIALEYAARDQRIRVVTESRNQGPWWNFGRVLDLAAGDYFIWAAHDDFRDANYVSALASVLDADPDAALCCPRFAKVTPEGVVKSIHPFPERLPDGRAARAILLLKRAHAPWIYGLFRTAPLRTAFTRLPHAPSPWGLDHLLILAFLVGQQLVGTNRTTLYQAKTGLSASLYRPSSVRANARLHAILLHGAFRSLGYSPLSFTEKLQLAPFLVSYIEKNVFQFTMRSIARGGLELPRWVRRACRRLHETGR